MILEIILHTLKNLSNWVDYKKIASLRTKHQLTRWLRGQRICLHCRRPGFNPRVRKTSGEQVSDPQMSRTPVFLIPSSHFPALCYRNCILGWHSLENCILFLSLTLRVCSIQHASQLLGPGGSLLHIPDPSILVAQHPCWLDKSYRSEASMHLSSFCGGITPGGNGYCPYSQLWCSDPKVLPREER